MVERLGGIPLDRIAANPAPGTATEVDVLDCFEGKRRRYELVDGVLVEKAMGYYESFVAAVLISFLEVFVRQQDLGIVLGEAGALRLAPGLVRIPDVSFIAWNHFPHRELPAEPIPDLAPDLAVEVMSTCNTEAEMERKTREYFEAGAKLVWLVDPGTRNVRVHTGPTEFRLVAEEEALDGGDLLPGFTLPLRQWFERTAGRRTGSNE